MIEHFNIHDTRSAFIWTGWKKIIKTLNYSRTPIDHIIWPMNLVVLVENVHYLLQIEEYLTKNDSIVLLDI